MLSMLKPRNRQYKVGWFVKEDEDITTKKRFRYSIVSESEKQYNQVFRNFISHKNSYVIKTNYMYDYEIGDIIYTDHELNNKFKIMNRSKATFKENEQALGTIKENLATYYILSLE